MKKWHILPLAGLVALAACSEDPAGMIAADGSASNVIVITPGVPAPPRVPGRPSLAVIGGTAKVKIDGSEIGRLPLALSTCTDGKSQQIKVLFSVAGSQAGNGSFKVLRNWVYGAAGWVGSDTVRIEVPNSGNSIREYEVDVTVTNTAAATPGSSTLNISTFGITNTNPNSNNNLSGTGTASVDVDFVACGGEGGGEDEGETPNTAPWLRVPKDRTVEATGPQGAEVPFRVWAYDREDGNLTNAVVCMIGGDKVTSPHMFPLDETTEVTCSVEDSHGATTTKSFRITVEDTTAPEFRRDGLAMGPQEIFEVIATDGNGWKLDLITLKITAFDLVDGDVTDQIACEPGIGSYLAIGIGDFANPVTCTVTDQRNNDTSISFNVNVTLTGLDGLGFLSPLRMSKPFSGHKAGSAIPHKFPAPKYADGTPATELANGLRLVLTKSDNNSEYEVPAEDVGAAAGSTVWRYDSDSRHYIFNLKTDKNIARGTWLTTVSYAGIKLAETTFTIDK